MQVEKIGDAAINRLIALGLAKKHGDWLAMDHDIGALYMFCLAKEMSEGLSAPLLADSSNYSALGQALLFESTSKRDASEVLVSLGIPLPSPAQVNDISVDDMVSFSHRRAAERQRFRQVIEDLIKSLKSIDDPNAVADILASKRLEVEQALTALRATIGELRGGAASTTARITAPAGAMAAIAAVPLSPVAASILAATGIAVAFLACYAETRGKLRTARIASPYHYLLSLEHELPSAS